VYIFDRSVRKQNPEIKRESGAVADRRVEPLLKIRAIFRVHSLLEQLESQPILRRRIVAEDSTMFLRPNELSSRDIPAPAAGVAHSLPFREKGFAP
jgi:hypothetical protein